MGSSVQPRVSTISHVGIIARYNFLNYFRARRFYVMLAIVLIISTLLSVAIGYYRPAGLVGRGADALAFYSTVWGSFVSLLVILSTAFFGGDAISGEFQNRTGYFLVPNPIRRSAIYVGKWLGALAASTMMLAIYSLIMLGNGLYYFPGSVPSEFAQAVLFAWIYLVAALSLAFAFSSLFKSSSISIFMSVILLLIAFPIIDLVTSVFADVEPWFSITYGAGIITTVLNKNPGFVSGGPGAGRVAGLFTASVPEGLAILGAYFVVTALLGLWLFQKKEFTS
jgi:ABC-2 type transport system permease protein